MPEDSGHLPYELSTPGLLSGRIALAGVQGTRPIAALPPPNPLAQADHSNKENSGKTKDGGGAKITISLGGEDERKSKSGKKRPSHKKSSHRSSHELAAKMALEEKMSKKSASSKAAAKYLKKLKSSKKSSKLHNKIRVKDVKLPDEIKEERRQKKNIWSMLCQKPSHILGCVVKLFNLTNNILCLQVECYF